MKNKKKKLKKRRKQPIPGSFEETWEVFQFYWNYMTEHPDCTFEEAEAARIKSL
jgi:hypothetical protein